MPLESIFNVERRLSLGWILRSFGWLLLIVALAVGARRLLEKPARIPPPGPGEKDTVVDGVRWRSREVEGAGTETTVFVHGLLTSSASWGRVLPAAGERGHAIAVDLPGFGYSDRPWPYDYAVGGQSAHLLHFLDARAIDHAVLVGSSLGGAVALLTAAARPDRVRALVLVDAASPASRIPWTIRALRTPGIGELEMELYIKPFLEFGLRERLYANPKNVTPELVEREWRPVTVPGTRRAALAAIRSNVRGYESLWQKFQVPTLVIWGLDDRLLPVAEGHRLASLIPGAKLVVLPGAGHLPQEEQPEAFSRAVSEFLDGLPSEDSSVPVQ
ncbi:MAG TPA: alpha/beta hydrolase [Thermoanaerobaculia bacterium]